MSLPVSNEVLIDIFRFLDRNNVEKSQLVSKRWDSLVKNHTPLWPLNKLGKFVRYNSNKDKIKYVDLEENDQYIAQSLAHIVETSLFYVLNTQGYQLPSYLEQLQRFVEKHSIKLRIANFVFVQGDYGEAKQDFVVQALPKIFHEYIHGSELTLVLSSSGFKNLISRPKSWEPQQPLQRLSMIINMVDDDNTFHPTNTIKVNDVLHFVEGSRYRNYGVYEFGLQNVEEGFMEKYFKAFDSRNSVVLIREMHWRTRHEKHLKEAMEFFTSRNFVGFNTRILGKKANVYEKRYDDGWVFRCELLWEIIWPHIRLYIDRID